MYPKTFAEFYDAHPLFIRQLIIKYHWALNCDPKDLEQEILSELLRKRVVESFDPAIYGEAVSLPIFLAYVRTIAQRISQTLSIQSQAKLRAGDNDAVSLSTPVSDEYSGTIADVLDDDGRSLRAIEASMMIDDFVRYVETHSPNLLPLLSAMLALGSRNHKDLENHLGLEPRGAVYPLMKMGRITRAYLSSKAKSRKYRQ